MLDALMSESQQRLRGEVRDFVREDVPRQLLLDMDADRTRYPREFLERAAKRRLLGLRFDPAHGGRGLRWVDEIVALEEIGVLGASLSCLYGLVSIVGEALHAFGTDAQKERYLRPTLEGRLGCAEALTEPRGGSDFFGATTVARHDGEHWVLSGQKRFVVGSEGADYFLVYAKTDPTARPRDSLSVLLVDREMGVEVKHVYGLLGARGGGTGRVLFREARVPAGNVVGSVHGGAEVFDRMMIPERLTTAAASVGMARAALEIAARYSDRRKAFGQRIRAFQGVSFRVADGAMKLDAARALVYAAARTVDAEGATGRSRRLVSEAKRFATEACWEIVNHAMQILGGIGYTSVYPVERLFRDARLNLIWTGTSEIMNLVIQHEYYRELGATERRQRDVERDAADAHQLEEKVYE